jgi:hypothetical protein
MSVTVHLFVDPRGWPAPLDPEFVVAILKARLQLPVDVRSRNVNERWYEMLPREDSTVIVLLTQPPAANWQVLVKSWLSPDHRLYAMYTDNVPARDIRELASMTADQAVPRAPYRIGQQNANGLNNAAVWAAGILDKAVAAVKSSSSYSVPISTPQLIMPRVPTPAQVAPARWRHLPSNERDRFYYPEDFTVSQQGAAGYKLTAASHRGKTHAHQGTFREDATALGSTRYWNIMAVSDGAGTADLARVGSNLAVTRAVEAMINAQPDVPTTEDLSRAIWAGLKAAYQAIKAFATDNEVNTSDLSATLQLLIHWPLDRGCFLAVAHVGDGIVTAETEDGQYYLLTDPDTDPDDSSRTLFLTSGPLRQWMERTKVYQFDEPLDIVALMTDGLSGDLEPYAELLHTHLFEKLRNRVLCYPLKHRESALLEMISYDRRGSFDDRTLAVLSRL